MITNTTFANIKAAKVVTQSETPVFKWRHVISKGISYLHLQYNEKGYTSMLEEEVKKCKQYNSLPEYKHIFTYYKRTGQYLNLPEVLMWYQGVPLYGLLSNPEFTNDVYNHCITILTKLEKGLNSLKYIIHGSISPYSICYSMNDGKCALMQVHSILMSKNDKPDVYTPVYRIDNSRYASIESIRDFGQTTTPLKSDIYCIGLSLLYAIAKAQNSTFNLENMEDERKTMINNNDHDGYIKLLETKIAIPKDETPKRLVMALFKMLDTNPEKRMDLSSLFKNSFLASKSKVIIYPGQFIKPITSNTQFPKIDGKIPTKIKEVVPGLIYIIFDDNGNVYAVKKITSKTKYEYTLISTANSTLFPVIKNYNSSYVTYCYAGLNLEQLYSGCFKNHEQFIEMLFDFSSIVNNLMDKKIFHGSLCPQNILKKPVSMTYSGLYYTHNLEANDVEIPLEFPFTTSAYTAPELLQYKDKNFIKCNVRSDIYSLGMTFVSILRDVYDEDELSGGEFNNIYKSTYISDTRLSSEIVKKMHNNYSQVCNSDFSALTKVIASMINEKPNERPTYFQLSKFFADFIPTVATNRGEDIHGEYIIKDDGLPKRILDTKEFISERSIPAEILSKEVGEITEVRAYNNNVHLLISNNHGSSFKCILKHFNTNKAMLMKTELSIYEKVKEIRKNAPEKVIDFPQIYCNYNNAYLICEFCGIDLGTFYMNKNFRSSKRDILTDIILTMITVLNALQFAELYHGDIRSENIMKHNGRSTLIDFECGFLNPAVNDDEVEMDSQLNGFSWQYAPPELLLNFKNIEAHKKVKLFPRKIDIYCIAKCFFLVLGRKIKEHVADQIYYMYDIPPIEMTNAIKSNGVEGQCMILHKNHYKLIPKLESIANPFNPSYEEKFKKLKSVMKKMLHENASGRPGTKALLSELNNLILV